MSAPNKPSAHGAAARALTARQHRAKDLMSIVGWVKRLMTRKPTPNYEGRLSRAATAGEYFAAELLEPAGLTDITVEWPDDVDLHFEQDKTSKSWMLSGLAQTAKMHEFTLHAKRANQDVTVNLRLPVSPDPWSIWKDQPVDWATLPYPKADTDSAMIKGNLTLVAASRRGRSHAHKALPRDDDMRIYTDETTGWHIATVADGAGSAPFSRLGSQTAVETVMTELPLLLAQYFDPDDIETTLRDTLGATAQLAAAAVADLTSAADAPEQAFSTTLLIGIARQTKDGWFVASISVGDGLIGLIADGQPPLMMSPDAGEYAGQTRFLRPDAVADRAALAARIHHRIVPQLTAFMLMTDGVSDPMFASDVATQDAKNWAALLDQITEAGVNAANPTAQDALCDWLNFKVKGEHDDRTIAIMFPDEASS